MTAEAALSLQLQERGVLPLIAQDVATDVIEERNGFKRIQRVTRRTKLTVVQAKQVLELVGLFPTHHEEMRIKW